MSLLRRQLTSDKRNRVYDDNKKQSAFMSRYIDVTDVGGTSLS